jgi:hypothetical protein
VFGLEVLRQPLPIHASTGCGYVYGSLAKVASVWIVLHQNPLDDGHLVRGIVNWIVRTTARGGLPWSAPSGSKRSSKVRGNQGFGFEAQSTWSAVAIGRVQQPAELFEISLLCLFDSFALHLLGISPGRCGGG